MTSPPPNVPSVLDSIDVRVLDSSGAFVGRLPETIHGEFADALSDASAWSMSVMRSAVGMDALFGLKDARLAVRVNNVERFRGLWEDDDDDRAAVGAVDNTYPVTIAGRGYGAILERGEVRGPSGDTTGSRTFTNVTPGTLLSTIIQEAQQRGCFQDLTYDFTSAADSSGSAWTYTINIIITVGTTIDAVLTNLVTAGYVDWRFAGAGMRVYNASTGPGVGYLGRDLPAVRFARAREGTATPRQGTRRALRNAIVAAGDEASAVERDDANSITTYGRREGRVTQTGVSDPGTLARIGDAALGLNSTPAEAYNLTYLPNASSGTPQPWVDYRAGDYVRYDLVTAGAGLPLPPLRVRTIAYTWNEQGVRNVVIDLNDLILEGDVAIQQQLTDLQNANQTLIAAQANSPTADLIAPSPPSAVALSSSAYLDVNGSVFSGVTATWPTVTTNADGTACTDLDFYLVSWQVGSVTDWTEEGQATATAAYLSGLNPGVNARCRVRAADKNGNRSPYTLSAVLTSADDAVAPNAPATPVVTPQIAALRIVWSGLDSNGLAMPVDFARVEVHASTVSGFAPSTATLIDALVNAGASPYVGLAYGTTYYVRLVAVDASGNRSAPSAQASGAPVQVATGDVANGAITDLQVGNLSASKLIASSIIADLTISARIKTANSGQRSEFDAVGFHVYDAGNNEVFRAATTGLSLTGAVMAGGVITGAAFRTSGYGTGRDYSYLSDDGFVVFKEGTRNLVANPAFGSGVNGWVTSVGASARLNNFYMSGGYTDALFGDTGLLTPYVESIIRSTTTAGNSYLYSRVPVTAGVQYTASVYGRSTTAGATNRLSIEWEDSTGTPRGSIASVTSVADVHWHRLIVSAVAPPGATYFRLVLWDQDNAGMAITLDYTMAQMEAKDHAAPYCDGTQAGCTWDGAAYTSSSTRTDGTVVSMGKANGGADVFVGIVVGSKFMTGVSGARIVVDATGSGRSIAFVNGSEQASVFDSYDQVSHGVPYPALRFVTGGSMQVPGSFTLSPETFRIQNLWGGTFESSTFGVVNADGSHTGTYNDNSSARSRGGLAVTTYDSAPQPGMNAGNFVYANVWCAAAITGSTARIKKNIRSLDGSGRGRLRRARPVRWVPKYDRHADAPEGSLSRWAHHEQVGFTAEEVHEWLPEAVYLDGEGKPGFIDSGQILAALFHAAQEMDVELSAIRAKVGA